jgi:hypothetical protein
MGYGVVTIRKYESSKTVFIKRFIGKTVSIQPDAHTNEQGRDAKGRNRQERRAKPRFLSEYKGERGKLRGNHPPAKADKDPPLESGWSLRM